MKKSKSNKAPSRAKIAAKAKPKADDELLKKIALRTRNPIYIWNVPKQHLTYINERYTEVMGYTAEDLAKFSYQEYLHLAHPDDIPRVLAYWEHLFKTQENSQIEYRVLCKSGELKYLIFQDSVFSRNEKGEIIEVLGTFIDVTEQKLAEAQARDQLATMNASSLIAETNLEGRITYMNERYCDLCRYSPAEVRDRSMSILNSSYHPREFFEHLWKTIQAGQIWKGEIRNKRKDGTFFWIDLTIVPFRDLTGKVYKYVMTGYDITTEKELQLLLTRQIEIAEKALSSASQRGRFISEMSHEIRGSLNRIKGFSDLLSGTSLNNEQIDYLERIKRSSQFLLDLLTNVLDASRIQENKLVLDRSPFEIRECLLEVSEMVRPSIESKGVKFEVNISEEIPEYILGDRYRLSQVLLNLLGNASKHTFTGCIRLLAGISEKPGIFKKQLLRITVQDTGHGIPNDRLSEIFKEFEQVSLKDSQGGSGLGLAISRQIVELMSGKIWAESEVGKGSTFLMEIPILLP